MFYVDSVGEVREGPWVEPGPVGSAPAAALATRCTATSGDDRVVAAVLTQPVEGRRLREEGTMALPPACLVVVTLHRLVVHRMTRRSTPRPRDLVYELPRTVFVRAEGPTTVPGASVHGTALFRADGVALAWFAAESELAGCRELVRQIDPSSG